MDQQKFLEVIQVQRHDFLNHLQVISGFLQLNKPEQAGDYIKQVIADLKVISQTAWVEIPEVTAALLVGFNEAAKIQMEMLLKVDTKLSACALPNTEVGSALEMVLGHYFTSLSLSETNKRSFRLDFTESPGKYTISLGTQISYIADPLSLEKGLAAAQERLNKFGGACEQIISGDNLEIHLDFPKVRGR